MSDDETFHPDEQNVIETRAQTEHKLEVMRRYFGQYAAIIAQSDGRFINNRHAWLVDLFAGAGLHRSVDHPDGQRDGTAVLACIHAWAVQRRFPSTRIHVRLVDRNRDYCSKLRERTLRFVDTAPNEQVDVSILPMDFSEAVKPICAEIELSGDHVGSLWFVDPHEPTPLAFEKLRPILVLSHSEVIINLDVTGIARMRGQVLSEKALRSARRSVEQSEQHLNALFNSAVWRDPRQVVRSRPNMSDHDLLAHAYAQIFRTFRCRNAYALDAGDNQHRYLIHLARSTVAEEKFRDSYGASNRRGLRKGRALDDRECAQYANDIMRIYCGSDTSVEDLYASEIVSLDRGQIRRVLTYAEQHDYGRLNNSVMHWFSERRQVAKIPRRRGSTDSQLDLFSTQDAVTEDLMKGFSDGER